MAKKKNKQNIPAIVITVFAVLLAAAAVTFLVITMNGGNNNNNRPPVITDEPGFIPSDGLIKEMEQAAYDLLPENYKVYQYLTLGMSVKEEPYGNLPEDGFYTCVNNSLPTFEAFSEYVRSIYTAETAEKLLTDPFGKGAVYGDDNGELGLSVDFEAAAEPGLSWTDVNFTCIPVSETVCDITVTLKDADGNDVDRKVKMQLEGESWKLTDLVG